MRYPEKLKKGDVIGLVSPCSQISTERKAQCIKTIENLGFRVKAADNIDAVKGGFMAGDEKIRGEWINRMFADPEVKGIFCIRGGDGGNRITDFLDLNIIKENPKVFVGYSDVTTLHHIFNQQCDFVTFHGPMVSSNMVDDFDKESRDGFFASLELDGRGEYTYVEPEGMEIEVAREGKAEAVITGGNLSVMCASIGTPYEIDTEGKILFIEEVGAHIGNADRHIYQLRNAGLLHKAAGIILGQFTENILDMEDYTETECILDAIGDLNIPVMFNIQSGHGKPMICIPLGAVCKMDTEEKSIVFR